jgi:hypothetical protein
MPLILDPGSYAEPLLVDLVQGFAEGLRETRADLDHPRGRVLDPAGIDAARDLLDAALRRMEPVARGDPGLLAAQVNLGYAAMVAAIDLMKCHTDVPRVPPPRPAAKSAGSPPRKARRRTPR